MNLSKEKFLIKRHSERSHAVAKSKNLGRCVIASLVRGAAISCLLFLAACGDDPKVGGTEEDAGIIAIENKTVSGVSQKGPFVNGSSVTVYGLDGETLAQTGNIYEGKIRSDMGDFSVKVVKLASQYALLKANGFYRNEVTGEKSNSQMTLYALTDLRDRDEVNVNLLTHLAYERSLYLATNSMSVANAKKQAEAEVFKSFEIEGDFDAAEDMNIFGENDQSAALLAISVLMQGDLKEADFSERLDNYARDIESDGVWDDKNTATAIADWASEKSLNGGLATIRANVEKWGQLFGVPPFEKYVNNFWWQNYGLGTCDAKREGEILQNTNTRSARYGEYFVCKNGAWRVASALEYDTYKWAENAKKSGDKDGDVRWGDVVKSNCYVFEDKIWRSGNDNDCSLDLRGCTSLRQDTVGLGKDKVWYICDMKNWRTAEDIEKDTATWGAGKFDGEVRVGQVNKGIYYIYETSTKVWREATTLEYDTYQVKCSADGKMFNGNVNTTMKYVCDGGVFRVAKELEFEANVACTSYNRNECHILPRVHNNRNHSYYKCTEEGWIFTTEKLNQGTMIDSRDGREYKTIGIGSQMWMAENLNYTDSINYPSMLGRNWCMDDADSCAKYGRYYSWSAAIDSVYWAKMQIICGYEEKECVLPGHVIGICPEGWHLPNEREWDVFRSWIQTINNDKSVGWKDNGFGFSALPAGRYEMIYGIGELAYGIGELAFFWSATSTGYMSMASHANDFSFDDNRIGMSVRCVKDEE